MEFDNIVELRRYNKTGYNPGGRTKRVLWYLTNMLFFKTQIPYPSLMKVSLLRLFGAKIGRGVVLKPNINIKYPWFLSLADYCWVGEGVWLDNLAEVKIGNNVVLSQGAYILTASHDYKKSKFDLKLGEIILEDGVWIGAKAIVTSGIKCHSHSVLTVGSVATSNLAPYMIYQGNPAKQKRKRQID
ncbi:acetyltransferase [hydrothermal vent metagenome]|uniref:Acetyltransferase n=1 Tax=hydrothermal vent metagenome TaxID=652676 RepID=A0A1W1C1V7_9ZZZZ